MQSAQRDEDNGFGRSRTPRVTRDTSDWAEYRGEILFVAAEIARGYCLVDRQHA